MIESTRKASTVSAIDEESGDATPFNHPGEWMLSPFARHAATANTFGSQAFGPPTFSGPDLMPALVIFARQAEGGDLTVASHLLTAQALSLDSIFTEMARRSALNMDENLNAAECYLRLALKAQANSRATIEALTKLHQPREQIVKHVHVNQGGQAVVADQFHHHGGEKNEIDDQPHEPNGAVGISSALLGQDKKWDALPMSGDQRQEALPDARRGQSRRTNR
jgi:hypothetical protein